MTYPPNGDGNPSNNPPQHPQTGGVPSQNPYGQPWGQQGSDSSQGYNDPTGSQPYGDQQHAQPTSGGYDGGQYGDQSYAQQQYGQQDYSNPATGAHQSPATGGFQSHDSQSTSVYGQPATGSFDAGAAQYGDQSYGQQQYGQQDPQYGSAHVDQGGYGTAQYGDQSYGDQSYGQQQYGQSNQYAAGYGQQPGAQPWGNAPVEKKSNKGMLAGIAAGAVLLLGGLGTWLALGPLASKVLDKDQVATDVSAQFQQEYDGERLSDLTCADELVVEKDKSYKCSAKADGEDVTIQLDLTDDEGAYDWKLLES